MTGHHQPIRRLVPPDGLAAAFAAAVAVFAFRSPRGDPMAVPVTPYVLGDSVVVTSTLAYTKKAEYVRGGGRVALLANGVHMLGRADVRADVKGAFFVQNLLDQELAKYPPARALVGVPFHRRVFSWYFGRALMFFVPEEAAARPGDDAATLVTLRRDGFPSIAPIGVPSGVLDAVAVSPPTEMADGPAQILQHRESADMSDLWQATLRGTLANGMFTVRRRIGSLEGGSGDAGEFARRKAASAARRRMAGWLPA
jgi:hypothetical protein